MGVQATDMASASGPTTTITDTEAARSSPSTAGGNANSRQPQRKRKSAQADFANDEEYKQFARRRNEATRRCRQKKEIELKELRDEMPKIKAESVALRQENERLKAENARLVEELKDALAKMSTGGDSSAAPAATPAAAPATTAAAPEGSSGKKQKKKVVKTSAVRDNWSGLDDSNDTTVSPEEADFCWYSDFLDTTIAYSPDSETYSAELEVVNVEASPSECSTFPMLDIAIPTDDVLCPGPSRQN